MEDKLKQQFKYIKLSLDKNLDTINMLLEQARSLSDIAETLSATDHTETKQQLEQKVKEILTIIDSLIKQTEELFNLYREFAETALKNK